MSVIYNPGTRIKETEYLFVDGAYLRERLKKLSEIHFNGTPISLEYANIFRGFDKVFYYDCLPSKNEAESDADYELRITSDRIFFEELRSLPNVHVFFGMVRGEGKKARQKGVDIQIAVHMLTHSFRRNVTKATLLAGDDDFTPLVEALVQEGISVTVWYNIHSYQKDLIYAADIQRKLTGAEISSVFGKEDFREEYNFPRVSGATGESFNARLSGKEILSEGKTAKNENAVLINEGKAFVAFVMTGKNSYFSCTALTEKSAKETLREYGYSIKWS